MTPQERADYIVKCHAQTNPWGPLDWLRADIVAGIKRACQEAVAAALASERQQRAIPGAPLTEERLAYLRKEDRLFWNAVLLSGDPEEGLVPNTLKERRDFLAHVAYLEGLVRDLGEDDPGKLAQWLSGRDAGLEEAAKEVPAPKLAAIIRALRRPTP